MSISSLDQENKIIIITCAGIVEVHRIHQLFAPVHTRAPWMKPAQPVEPRYLIATLLIGAVPSDASRTV